MIINIKAVLERRKSKKMQSPLRRVRRQGRKFAKKAFELEQGFIIAIFDEENEYSYNWIYTVYNDAYKNLCKAYSHKGLDFQPNENLFAEKFAPLE